MQQTVGPPGRKLDYRLDFASTNTVKKQTKLMSAGAAWKAMRL